MGARTEILIGVAGATAAGAAWHDLDSRLFPLQKDITANTIDKCKVTTTQYEKAIQLKNQFITINKDAWERLDISTITNNFQNDPEMIIASTNIDQHQKCIADQSQQLVEANFPQDVITNTIVGLIGGLATITAVGRLWDRHSRRSVQTSSVT